ncbi:hypothetical protein ACTXT7_010880 [Hymenolepis weldensis]
MMDFLLDHHRCLCHILDIHIQEITSKLGYCQHVKSFSKKSDGGILIGSVFSPLHHFAAANVRVLGRPSGPALSGDKFVQPAFLEDLEDTAVVDDAQKSEEQQAQQYQWLQDGKGISLPKFSIEEIQGSPDMDKKDPELAKKRQKVKEMTKYAWDNYVKYAWGHNELRPKSKTFHDTDVLGRVPLGATIVDSIDTLYIMGLEKEYMQASKWIKEKLDLSDAESWDSTIPVRCIMYANIMGLALNINLNFYKKNYRFKQLNS